MLTAWITKILIHGSTIDSLGDFYKALAVGAIPSWFVALVMTGTFLAVASITWYIARNSTGEITEVGKSSRSNWLG